MTGASPVSALHRRRWILLAAAALVAACLAAYANSLHGAFLYDDFDALVDNPSLRSLWPPWGALFPRPGITVSGRPILAISFAFNYAAGGLDTRGYHLANILIHTASVLLLFGLVRRTAERTAAAADATLLGATVALLWGLHPLQTEAVTYIVQRAESLAGLFFLGTFYAFVRSLPPGESPAGPARPQRLGRWATLAILSCLLGVGTKEILVTAPVLVLVYDRTFVSGGFAEAGRRRRALYLGLFGTWIPLLVLVGSAGWNRSGTVGPGIGVPVWAYWLTQTRALTRYLALCVWPRPLIFDYGTFFVGHVGEVLPQAVAVALLLAAAGFALRLRLLWGFLGAWFFAILAPTSLLPGTTQMIVEHRMYLPLAAVVAGMAAAVWTWTGRAGLWVLCCAALGLGWMTHVRNQAYRSEVALWGDTAAKLPRNPDAAFGVGNAYLHEGRLQEAVKAYQTAVTLAPADAYIRNNLGDTLSRMGRGREALVQLAAAVRLKPGNRLIQENFGIALADAGRAAEAIGLFENGPVTPAETSRVESAWAKACLQLGRRPEAVRHAEAAVASDPDDLDAQSLLAAEMIRTHRYAEAEGPLRAWVRVEPRSPAAHGNLGAVLMQLDRFEEAAREFRTVTTLLPGSAQARADLRRALAAAAGPGGAPAPAAAPSRP